MGPVDVYLEVGKVRTLAGAVAWPGWCRSGRDEAAALQALLAYGARYARMLGAAGIAFRAPDDGSAFAVVEQLAGNVTTDFGAPAIAPTADAQPVGDAELAHFEHLLRACWGALDATVEAAAGKTLQKGPRGGGRDLDAIAQHVQESEVSYLARLAWKLPKDATGASAGEQRERSRQAVLDALGAATRGEVPARGPRGGAIWTPRYFVRRVAWHVLDHTWEIEDRIL